MRNLQVNVINFVIRYEGFLGPVVVIVHGNVKLKDDDTSDLVNTDFDVRMTMARGKEIRKHLAFNRAQQFFDKDIGPLERMKIALEIKQKITNHINEMLERPIGTWI